MKFFLSFLACTFLLLPGGNMGYADRDDFFDEEITAATPTVWCAPGLVGCKTNQFAESKGYRDSALVGTAWKVMAWMVTFTASVAVLMLVVSGVMFLFAGGDEELLGKAKKTAMYAVIGILVAMFAYAIVELINSLPFPNAVEE